MNAAHIVQKVNAEVGTRRQGSFIDQRGQMSKIYERKRLFKVRSEVWGLENCTYCQVIATGPRGQRVVGTLVCREPQHVCP